ACLAHAPATQTADPACARSTDGGACGTGLRCTSGQCTCDSAACAAAQGAGRGCCDGAVCRAGNSINACGANGSACVGCGAAQCCGTNATDSNNACRLVCL